MCNIREKKAETLETLFTLTCVRVRMEIKLGTYTEKCIAPNTHVLTWLHSNVCFSPMGIFLLKVRTAPPSLFLYQCLTHYKSLHLLIIHFIYYRFLAK